MHLGHRFRRYVIRKVLSLLFICYILEIGITLRNYIVHLAVRRIL